MTSPSSCDLNCLSYWFPKLEAAGVPVPRTKIVRMPKEAVGSVWAALDGKDGTPEETAAMQAFMAELRAAAQEFDLPLFLRTGHGSGKHDWKNTCFVTDLDMLPTHVSRLVEWSEMVDMMGLPWDVWAVREFLPVAPVAVLPAYANMPVNREFRFFVRDGKVVCGHNYWPIEAIREGLGPAGGHEAGADERATMIYAALCRTEPMSEIADAARIAGQVATAIPGAWSVDVLETQRGWYVTDMAEARKSFHWPGCQHQGDFS